jgi:glucokinase
MARLQEGAMLLVGDLGGTKIDLAIINPDQGPRAPVARAQLPSAGFPSLEAAVRAFLADVTLPVSRACFAVAGPVLAGRARITNLPWERDEATLASALGLQEVALLNDLEAIARAVPLLTPDDLRALTPGTAMPGGAIAVVAPGTGLGEAFLTWDGARYRAHPSEGGHTDFAPTTPLQRDLLRAMQGQFDHVSYEMVCSGIGIPHLYAFLRGRGDLPEAPDLARQLAGAPDATRLIVAAGLAQAAPDPLSAATLALFVEILAAEAGNLALKVLATGGVYLAGGLALRVLPLLEGERFALAFRRKGRFADLLSRLPVRVILSPAALLGAAAHGLALSGR